MTLTNQQLNQLSSDVSQFAQAMEGYEKTTGFPKNLKTFKSKIIFFNSIYHQCSPNWRSN